MDVHYHKYDLPDDVVIKGEIAVDTEAMGLNHQRDRLCVVQMADNRSNVHIVHFPEPNFECKNLKAVLSDDSNLKIFHFARFDVAAILKHLDIKLQNIYCTKIASKLARTYTDYHGLKDLCQALLSVKLSKQQQSSDWGVKQLSKAQIDYAASDVLYLHQLKEKLDVMLLREGKTQIAQRFFDFMLTVAELDKIKKPLRLFCKLQMY